MPEDSFVHLHVASGYSLRHGASSPAALVARAAALGQDSLALTDRDGLYGAVRFVLACRDAGIAPILGVDLAFATSASSSALETSLGSRVQRTSAGRVGHGPTLAERTSIRRTPARGGRQVDQRYSRVVLLARGRTGWASLCRLVSAAHLGLESEIGTGSSQQLRAGEPRNVEFHGDEAPTLAAQGRRGAPVVSQELIAQHSEGLVALLGPESDVGRAVMRRRPDQGLEALNFWREIFGRRLAIEIVSHRARDSALAVTDVSGAAVHGLPYSSAAAARMLSFAREQQIPAVLAAAVRHAQRDQAPVIDVLDAIRRLVPLDSRHLDRANGEGHLADGAHMRELATEIVHLSGLARDEGRAGREVDQLLADTRQLAQACRLDPVTDLGIGEVHVPELDLILPARTAQRSSLLRDRGPAALAAEAHAADQYLRQRCESAFSEYLIRTRHPLPLARDRLEAELATISTLGFAGYFLTVAEVVDLIKGMNIRVAARGSGAGSLVNHVLGISGVDPLAHGLVMERFLSPLRRALPDIDIDVESARRTEVYEQMLERFGGERCVCISMRDTYRVRHAVRDVGAALGMPRGEIDAFATAFPHIRARDARNALAELPELRSSGLGKLAARGELDGFLSLVEALDGLPRHIALHPCGVVLSDATLLDRTPVEASWRGFPMSQFDKDDVEELGLLKLDVLGIRMQSSMAYAVDEVARVDGVQINLDEVRLDDEPTYDLVKSAHTLGCFQIESSGQRELIGKFAPDRFDDLITDISLFRPGPVKSDMITPFLRARQGWNEAEYLHPDLRPALEETYGVVVFHEQVMKIVSIMTGCSLAEADEIRRSLGSPESQQDVRAWFYPAARNKGYDLVTIERVWEVLKAFASFGFCKAHAAAFAIPTYQSAWLKTHHPAAFLAGVLTHDPGMYPKRLILDDARNLGIAVLGLDVNTSDNTYRVERVSPYDEPPPEILGERPRRSSDVPGLPDGSAYGIRLSLADVKGMSAAEIERIMASRPYQSLSDFWTRASVSRPIVERLVLAGGFDSIYGIGLSAPVRRRGRVTRRDLLLQIADLDRYTRAASKAARAAAPKRRTYSRADSSRGVTVNVDGTHVAGGAGGTGDVVAASRRQSQAPMAAIPASELDVQLTLELGDAPGEIASSGLPEMTDAERVRAELEILGLDASRHVVDFYAPMLNDLGVTPSRDLLTRRSTTEVLVAGVKVATQTPPVRSGRRVVFLTLDDSTGPVDATFFEDVQGPYAATVFGSWLLLVRGITRRTGPRGISIRATGAWELGVVYEAWKAGGKAAVAELLDSGLGTSADSDDAAVEGRAGSRSSRPVTASPPEHETSHERAERLRRVLVHASGFRQSPYADIAPQGIAAADTRSQAAARGARAGTAAGADSGQGGPTVEKDSDRPTPRKLWHSSNGSSGW